MNKLLIASSIVASLMFGSVAANAVVYTDVHDSSDIIAAGHALGAVQLNASGLNSYSGTFDLTAAGYTPGEEIDSAVATFWFRDYLRQAGDDDAVEIDLGSILFAAAQDIEFAILSVGNSLTLGLIADLTADGKLDFTIRAIEGAFLFKGGSLSAEVPDGGATVLLLGLGLLGLAGIRRKIA